MEKHKAKSHKDKFVS